MGLCKNRPEGFGPKSTFSTHLPTTCFASVVIVPLATWIYLLVVFVMLILLLLSPVKDRSPPATTLTTSPAKEGTTVDISNTGDVSRTTKSRLVLKRIFKSIYYLLIIAAIALLSVEIARLSTAQLGIGLLPFTYVGLLVALFLHVSSEFRMFHSDRIDRHCFNLSNSQHGPITVKCINALFWVLLVCVMAIMIAAEAEEQRVAGHRISEQAKYPIADEIADDAAIMSVTVVLLLLELTVW